MYTLTVFIVLFAGITGGVVAVWLLSSYSRGNPVFTLGLFLASIAFWLGTHLGTLTATTEPWLLFYTQLSYVGVVTVPPLWLIFALQYTDRSEWLTTARLAGLFVVPAATLIVVFTTQTHSLFYTSTSIIEVGGHPTLRVGVGPWHVVNVAYAYLLLGIGTAMVGFGLLSANDHYRLQSGLLATLISLPWGVNIAFHLGLRPVPWVDLAPVTVVAVGVPLAVFLVRSDYNPFIPIVHERVFRTMADPMLVVRENGLILDLNNAARSVLTHEGSVRGKQVGTVLPPATGAGNEFEPWRNESIEWTLDSDSSGNQYLLRCHEVEPRDGTEVRGYVISLTDITDQKERQRVLERKNKQLERLAKVISHDMKAPLSTAEKVLTLLRRDLDDSDDAVEQSLEDLEATHERLRGFANYLPRLTRESADVKSTEACDLESIARTAWRFVDTGNASLEIVDTHTIEADRQRLQQVFENLLQNAVEHGPEGQGNERRPEGELPETSRPVHNGDQDELPTGKRMARNTGSAGEMTNANCPPAGTPTKGIRVRVGTTSEGIYIEDNGKGIRPEIREQVFEYEMSTGDNSGFGLAIVRTIVESHGWEITATESETDGARFEIRTRV